MTKLVCSCAEFSIDGFMSSRNFREGTSRRALSGGTGHEGAAGARGGAVNVWAKAASEGRPPEPGGDGERGRVEPHFEDRQECSEAPWSEAEPCESPTS